MKIHMIKLYVTVSVVGIWKFVFKSNANNIVATLPIPFKLNLSKNL